MFARKLDRASGVIVSYNLFTRRMQSSRFYCRLLGPVSDRVLINGASILLNGASTTTKHCLPKDRGKVKKLSISMVSFRIAYSLQ